MNGLLCVDTVTPVTKAICALSILAVLAACGGPATSPSTTGDGRGPGVQAPQAGLPAKNVIITASCQAGNGGLGGVITLDGWEPQSFRHIAAVTFNLPPQVLTTNSGYDIPETIIGVLCDFNMADMSGYGSALRSAFDRDFTRVAVVTWDPQREESHVGFVDRSGKLTDLTGDTGFGMTPHEQEAVLSPDGKTVYFTYQLKGEDEEDLQIASRSGPGQPKQLIKADHRSERQLVRIGDLDKVALTGIHSHVRLSPDGKRFSIGGRVHPVPAAVASDYQDNRGGDDKCEPTADGIGWVDSQTMLCSTDEYRFTVSSNPAQRILPPTDRETEGLLVSPDGKRFAFLAGQRTMTEYYLCDTKPNSTPTKVDPGKPVIFIDWR